MSEAKTVFVFHAPNNPLRLEYSRGQQSLWTQFRFNLPQLSYPVL